MSATYVYMDMFIYSDIEYDLFKVYKGSWKKLILNESFPKISFHPSRVGES